jgi:hypothetical protein
MECLERDLKEEASINVTPVNSPITYHTKSWDEEPIPDSETHGILFLGLEDIDLICKELITINDLLKRGGRAIF